ncbi:MAG: methyltransferase domain-containing protein [Hyphomicrobiales bacterium]|nr:methyltransferase domain-containing protein [Hyphomicrobiales bacterium]
MSNLASKRPSQQRRPSGSSLADQARFFKSWFENPGRAGAISPSGPFLARTMAGCFDIAGEGPILELGPGTGPVTAALIERGIAESRLVMVEYDPTFCTLLRERYPEAKVIQGDAYDLMKTLEGHMPVPAVAIVSSLPLLLRPPHDRQRVLEHSFRLGRPDAPYVQFSYGLKSPLPRSGLAGDIAYNSRRLPPVLLNVPPAHVWVFNRLQQEIP